MEQVTHIIVDENSYSIIVCGSRGSQQVLQFHFVTFYDVVDYCRSRMRPEHILYFT